MGRGHRPRRRAIRHALAIPAKLVAAADSVSHRIAEDCALQDGARFPSGDPPFGGANNRMSEVLACRNVSSSIGERSTELEPRPCAIAFHPLDFLPSRL